MTIPGYVRRIQAEEAGTDAGAVSRRARTIHCRGCGQVVMRGLDGDVLALDTVIDPTPLDVHGELRALMQGRRTLELEWTGKRYEIERRDRWHISNRPASDERVHVVREHECEKGAKP